MIGQTSLRRYALKQAIKVAKDPNIDPAIKGQLIQHMSDTAAQVCSRPPSPAYGRLVYRLIAIALGLVAILSVVFSFVLLLGKHMVDSAFYTLGSAAVGALGGVFSPQNASDEGRPGPGGEQRVQEQPGDLVQEQPGDLVQEQPGDLVQEQPGDLVQEQPGDLVQEAAGGPGAGAAGGPGAGAAGGPGAGAAGGPGAGAAGGPGAGAVA